LILVYQSNNKVTLENSETGTQPFSRLFV